MSGTKKNDSDQCVQSRAEGGRAAVKERHQRGSAVTERKAESVNSAREIVNNLGGGAVRIKNLDNKFHDSDTHGRKNESPAKDRR